MVEFSYQITDVITIAERLKYARELAKLTQAQLADNAGVSQGTIANIESGIRKSPRELLEIAKALNIRPEWLKTGLGPMEPAAQRLRNQISGIWASSDGHFDSINRIQEAQADFQADTQRDLESNLDSELYLVNPKRTPVVGTAKLGDNGYYEELGYPTGHGDGWVENYSHDPESYALRVKGDSMHPAIRHGSFVVVEPNGQCIPGEYVVLALRNGKKMVKELVIERETEIVIESVNGNHRQTIDKVDIEKMHAVSSIVAASKWKPT